MEWLFALVALCAVGALIDDIHAKWHERQMIIQRHWKETIYT